MTPKVDKGKDKAEPEPEQPEMVLSPKTFMVVSRRGRTGRGGEGEGCFFS